MAQVQQQVAAYIPLYQHYLQEQKATLQRELAQLQRSQTRQVQPTVEPTAEAVAEAEAALDDDPSPAVESTAQQPTLETDLDDDIGLDL